MKKFLAIVLMAASAHGAWADGLDAGVRLTKISQNDRTRVLEYVYKEWLRGSKSSQTASK